MHEGGRTEALETKKKGTNCHIRFAVGEGIMFVNMFRDMGNDPVTYCVALDITNQESGKMGAKTETETEIEIQTEVKSSNLH